MCLLWQVGTAIAAAVLMIGATLLGRRWVKKKQLKSVAQQDSTGWPSSQEMSIFNHSPRQLGSIVKERVSAVWKTAMVHLTRGRQWLMRRRRMVFWVAAIAIAVALLIGFISGGGASWYGKYYATIAPLLTLTAGVAVAAVALVRHFAQTDADRQRRITESFSKAVEQLGSDKLEVRLGGIYSLERISKESPDDYRTVMENLTAFVRGRSRGNEGAQTSQNFEERVSQRAYFLWLDAGKPDRRAEDFWAEAIQQDELAEPPPTDIAAVLTVIKRRTVQVGEREAATTWCLDLHRAVLKQVRTSRTLTSKEPTSRLRISKGPTYRVRISKGPTYGFSISKGPTYRVRISKGPGSGPRISKGPISLTRISKGPAFREAHLRRSQTQWRASRRGLPQGRASRRGKP